MAGVSLRGQGATGGRGGQPWDRGSGAQVQAGPGNRDMAFDSVSLDDARLYLPSGGLRPGPRAAQGLGGARLGGGSGPSVRLASHGVNMAPVDLIDIEGRAG